MIYLLVIFILILIMLYPLFNGNPINHISHQDLINCKNNKHMFNHPDHPGGEIECSICGFTMDDPIYSK